MKNFKCIIKRALYSNRQKVLKNWQNCSINSILSVNTKCFKQLSLFSVDMCSGNNWDCKNNCVVNDIYKRNMSPTKSYSHMDLESQIPVWRHKTEQNLKEIQFIVTTMLTSFFNDIEITTYVNFEYNIFIQ